MGYIQQFRGLSMAALLAELRTPSIDPRAAASQSSSGAMAAPRWSQLADEVARALAAGGGQLGGPHVLYVDAVVHVLGTPFGSVQHSSAGGEDFRREFLAGPVADALGRDFVARLVNRDIGGLTWADTPVLGWVSVAEARQAAARLATYEVPEHDDTEDVYTVLEAVESAAARNVDLVSSYG